MIGKGYSLEDVDAAFDRVAKKTGRDNIALCSEINGELARGQHFNLIKDAQPVVDNQGRIWARAKNARDWEAEHSKTTPITALITTTVAMEKLEEVLSSHEVPIPMLDQIMIGFDFALREHTEVQS